jgi:hypothetical protein
MNINQRSAIALQGMLTRHGFDVQLQQRIPSPSAFDDEAALWGAVATFRAVWVSTPSGDTSLDDGRPASRTRPTMYIAYRDDLAGTEKVANKRIVYRGLAYGLQSATIEGDAVGIMLGLSDGRYITGEGLPPTLGDFDGDGVFTGVIDGGEV